MRILPVDRIPINLWQNRNLRLPSCLSRIYVNELNRLGLLEMSVTSGGGAIHGGATAEETNEHFALRFAVSAGRIQFSTLAPDEAFEPIGNALLSTFSDGHVALLDIPCGTGAMSAALVSTLTQLRQSTLLPRLPLTITICAGDFSQPARDIFELLMQQLKPEAATEGIILNWSLQDWDATRGDHTARMMDRWLEDTQSATEHVVIVSNFSGALHNTGQFDAFSPCFEHILSRLHDKQSTLVWVEPGTTSAKSGIIARISRFIAGRIPWFRSAPAVEGEEHLEATYQIEHPVSSALFPTNVIVQRFNRQ